MRPFSIALIAVAAIPASTQPFSCFPRMRDQVSVKPFEKRMPDMPPNTVPYSGPARLPATMQQAARVPNPARRSAQAVALGRIYYGYYCQTCHGERGEGDGTVGRSYVPQPTDLTSARVQGMSDGALAFAMASGVGHELVEAKQPVLGPTVAVERRWYIVWYIRSTAKTRTAKQPPALRRLRR